MSCHVCVQVENYISRMLRRDLSNGLVEIQHGSGTERQTDRWLVARKMLDASAHHATGKCQEHVGMHLISCLGFQETKTKENFDIFCQLCSLFTALLAS